MSIKLIVMGSGGVGKSALTSRYTKGTWVEKYNPTIEDSYSTTADIDGKALQVEILDTAGQEEYSPLRETFMHTGDGFLLVYSITDDQTFEDLASIRSQVLRVHPNQDVPMIVVGNKLDLAADERAVSPEEGSTFADGFGAPFLEISAKENTGVTDAFTTIIRKILQKNPNAGTGEGSGGVLGAGVDTGEDEANGAAASSGGDGGNQDQGGSSGGKKKLFDFCIIL